MLSFFYILKWIYRFLRYSISCNYTTSGRGMLGQMDWVNIAVNV